MLKYHLNNKAHLIWHYYKHRKMFLYTTNNYAGIEEKSC